MRSLGDGFRRPCAALLISPGSCADANLTPDSRRRFEVGSAVAVSDPGSSPDVLFVKKRWDSRCRSLVVLLGKDIPGKPSPLVVSILGLGVGVGSTDTTDLIGKTRSVAVGLIAPNGESEVVAGELVLCASYPSFGFHGVRCDPEALRFWSCEHVSERDR